MSRSKSLIAAAVLAAAVAPSTASAAVKLTTDGAPLVIRELGADPSVPEGETTLLACIDRGPKLSIGASAAPATPSKSTVYATWLPTSWGKNAIKNGSGRKVIDAGTTQSLDLVETFQERSDAGLVRQLPVGVYPGRGSLYLYAVTPGQFAGITFPVISNVVRVSTTLTVDPDPEATCAEGQPFQIGV